MKDKNPRYKRMEDAVKLFEPIQRDDTVEFLLAAGVEGGLFSYNRPVLSASLRVAGGCLILNIISIDDSGLNLWFEKATAEKNQWMVSEIVAHFREVGWIMPPTETLVGTFLKRCKHQSHIDVW